MAESSFTAFLKSVEDAILTPALALLFFAAFLLFVVGVIGFIRSAEDPKKRAASAQGILWGVIGMAIMFGVRAIIAILQNIAHGF